MAGTPASVNGREDSYTNPAYAPAGRGRASFPLGQVLGSHEGHIKWPSARAELVSSKALNRSHSVYVVVCICLLGPLGCSLDSAAKRCLADILNGRGSLLLTGLFLC